MMKAAAIEDLDRLKVNELQEKFAEIVGEQTRSPNRKFLIRRITEAIAAGAPEGEIAGLSGGAPVGGTADPGADPIEVGLSEPEPRTGLTTPDATEALVADLSYRSSTFGPCRPCIVKSSVAARPARAGPT